MASLLLYADMGNSSDAPRPAILPVLDLACHIACPMQDMDGSREQLPCGTGLVRRGGSTGWGKLLGVLQLAQAAWLLRCWLTWRASAVRTGLIPAAAATCCMQYVLTSM